MPHKNNTSLVSIQPVTICDLDQKQIESRIFTIRGVQVMLDRDLAFFFGVETKALNQAVKRNAIRFPEDFMFQLTKEEAESVLLEKSQSDSWSQNVTLKRGHNIKYLPYAFTEEGVSQLSSILKSPIAAEMSVHIIRAFVAMRRYIATHAALFQRIESLEEFRVETRRSLQEVNERFDNLLSKMDDGSVKPIEGIFVEGQVLDARIYLEQLIGSANREIILIDNYVDARTFDILEARKPGVKATIYTISVGRKLQGLAAIHDVEYPGRTIELKQYNSRFHDRFLIVDDDLYHFGASFNELGKRLFAFDKMGLDKNLILSQL